MAAQRLFLLDAYALIFRAHFAFAKNPRMTSSGLDTSAVYGFALALMDVLEKERPSHLAVVFDIGGSEARESAFPAYKAHRDETPEGIKTAVPIIHQMLETLNIPHLGIPGYEADDVIGTLAQQAEKAGFEVFMMTPDKDFGQLVTEKIKMYRPGRGGAPAEVWGVAEVCERWGIQHVDQVVDMLGLMGDAVDNIPGIPSVGEKTAAKLLAEYGSLEAILENAPSIKCKLGEKIAENAEMGRLSKQLARIITDVPIELDTKRLEMEPADEAAFRELCASLEFRTVTDRLLRAAHRAATGENLPAPERTAESAAPNATSNSTPSETKAAAAKRAAAGPSLFDDPDAFDEEPAQPSLFATAATTEHFYQCINDAVGCKMLVEKLLLQPSVSFDTETTGLDVRTAELVGLSFSFEAHTGFYVPIPADRTAAHERLALFQPFFSSTTVEVVGQNLKFDLQILLQYGIQLRGPLFDTLLAHYLLQPDQRHGLDFLSEAYLGYQPIPIESLIGSRGPRQKTMGTPGERFSLELELKVLADVGLLGMPNAGKSTFIRAVSAARPKVGDYPFTTLAPNLGVVRTDEGRSFVIADVPGLIEGAADGAGLGHRFLRHLQRTNLLLHLVDLAPFDTDTDPVREAKAIVEELNKYDQNLWKKPRWLVLNKLDLIPEDERKERVEAFLSAYFGPDFASLEEPPRWFAISAMKSEGCNGMVFAIQDYLDAQPKPSEEDELEAALSGPQRAAAAAAAAASEAEDDDEEDDDDDYDGEIIYAR